MQCPKCGYLGFEASRQCRNCSYDFALAESASPSVSLEDLDRVIGDDRGVAVPEPAAADAFDARDLDALLRQAEPAGVPGPRPADPAPSPAPASPFAASVEAGFGWDAAVSGTDAGPSPGLTQDSPLDLDLGSFDLAGPEVTTADAAAPGRSVVAPVVPSAPPAPLPAARREPPPDPGGLDEDVPLVRLQRPRAPVAVRKTPMTPRLRAASRPSPQEPAFDFQEPLAVAGDPVEDRPAAPDTGPLPASPAVRRLGALLVDAVLFAAIDLAVVYLTLRMAGLGVEQWRILPVWPLLVFLGGLKLAYATTFTALGGQTIGKMAAGIRVVSLDGGALSAGAAFRRTVVAVGSVVAAGGGYVPGLVGQCRALHDRLAGSRVVQVPAA